MSNEITEVQQKQTYSLAPKDFEQALKFSEMMSKSNLVPKEFVGNAGNIMVAVQWGMELGLQPMQAMQNIAVINGRPSLWGDSVLALARSSSLCEYIIEEDDGKVATCRAKRRGQDAEIVASFSMDDATKAGLASKAGPWTQYPKRMRQMRARAFCLRDAFPDVLRGMPIAEELQDIEPAQQPQAQQRKDPISVAQAAAAVEHDDLTLSLIADLELIAKEQGEEAYAKCWTGLTKEQRKSIGAAKHEELKALAKPTVIDNETGEIA